MMNDITRVDFSQAVVDVEHRCIDRNTKLGKQFDMVSAYVDGMSDPDMRDMLKAFLSYTEAAIVVGKLQPGDAGQRKIQQLRQRMVSD